MLIYVIHIQWSFNCEQNQNTSNAFPSSFCVTGAFIACMADTNSENTSRFERLAEKLRACLSKIFFPFIKCVKKKKKMWKTRVLKKSCPFEDKLLVKSLNASLFLIFQEIICQKNTVSTQSIFFFHPLPVAFHTFLTPCSHIAHTTACKEYAFSQRAPSGF